MPTTPVLKLTYFDMYGRAGIIRKTLTLGGVPFVDERVAFDLTETKPRLPYGKVPILEVDGDVVAESLGILRYAGRLTGMYPPSSEPLAAAMVDELIDSFDDLNERLMMPSYWEQDPVKKQAMREALIQGPLPRAFAMLEKRVAQIQALPYFQQHADHVFLHHVLVWDNVGFFKSGDVEHVPTTILDSYTTLLGMYDKVEGASSLRQRDEVVVSPPAVPKALKLTYFDMPGRAEQIRLALVISGIPFEDERLSFEDFTKRKSELPNGQVPVLQVDGKVELAQSIAILRFVGTLGGMYRPNEPIWAMKIDEVLTHIAELYAALEPSFAEEDPEKKKELRDKLVATTIPTSLDGLNKRLAHFKSQAKTPSSPWAMGEDAPTIADLGIYSLVTWFQSGSLDHVPKTMVDAYPHLVLSSDAVQEFPRVKEWYGIHPMPVE